MINYAQIGMLIVAAILLVILIMLEVRYGNRYETLLGKIDPREHPFGDIYPIGFAILDIIHFDLKSQYAIKKVRQIAQINGKMYAEFYYYLMLGQRISLLYLGILGVLLAGVLTNQIILLLFGILVIGLLVYYLQEEFNDKLKDKRNELLMEFPRVLSKMALLIDSGMMLREAWRLVGSQGEGELYLEMQNTDMQIANGYTERDGYREFADRCEIKEIKHFISALVQNLEKGNAELAIFIKSLSDDLWLEKKNIAKQKGETAKSKLLLPTGLIFLGILALIMVPMFGGLSM
jgi:tight adherence protein C